MMKKEKNLTIIRNKFIKLLKNSTEQMLPKHDNNNCYNLLTGEIEILGVESAYDFDLMSASLNNIKSILKATEEFCSEANIDQDEIITLQELLKSYPELKSGLALAPHARIKRWLINEIKAEFWEIWKAK